MSVDTNLVEKLEKMLAWKKSRSFYAERLEITEEELDQLFEILRGKPTQESDSQLDIEFDAENNEVVYNSYYDHPPTPEEVIRDHKIDTTKWKLANLWCKKKPKGFLTSALFAEKREKDVVAEDIKSILDSYKSTYKPLEKHHILVNDSFSRDYMAFIDLTDFHLDRQELSGKTLEEKIEEYHRIVDRLVFKSYTSYKLEEIVLVVGSDMLNSDTFFYTTTRGTPQTALATWDKSYTVAFDIYAQVINRLSQFCSRLKVILVQGNHDRTKSFYLAHALSRYFEPDSRITFDVEVKNRKVHIFGNTFIGLHHGDCKIADLPLVFAQEFSSQWGPCLFKEIKVGDKHFYMEKEILGVRVKQIPSLSGPDQWSDDNNYIKNIRAGLISIYDIEKGKVAEFEERI